MRASQGIAAALILSSILPGFAAEDRSGDIVGYVFRIHGSWRLAPQYATDLSLGYAVRNGDRIKRYSANADDHIFIGLIDGSRLNRDCTREVDGCPDLAVNSGAPTGMSNRLKVLWKVLHPPPLEPEIAASRGEGSELREAVLPWRVSGTDVAPALADVRFGEWNAEFRPVNSSAKLIHANLRWLPPNAKLDKALAPGVYTLQLVEDGKGTNTVVVLVSREIRDSSLFKEALNWIDRDPASPLPTDARQYFLRSVLYELWLRGSKGK